MVFWLSWELFLKDTAIRTFFTPSIFIHRIYWFAPKCCCFCLRSLREDLTHPFTFPNSLFLEEEEALPSHPLEDRPGLDLRTNFSLAEVLRLWNGGVSMPGRAQEMCGDRVGLGLAVPGYLGLSMIP